MQGILGTQQDLELDPRRLGRLRSSIRREIKPLMDQIDALVEAISTGQDLLVIQQSWERLLDPNRPTLPGADDAELSRFLRSEREGWNHRDFVLPEDES